MKRLGIVWFRNDLRLHDNEVGILIMYTNENDIPISNKVLSWAHTNHDYVLHVYCFDPRQITNRTYKCDFVKCDKYRLKFLIESIEDLHISLIDKGNCLLTYRDFPEHVLRQLIQQYKDDFELSISFQQEVTREETDVEKSVRQLALDHHVHVKEFWTSTLYHPDDLPYNNPKAFPDIFTQFRTALEKSNIHVRRLVSLPNTLKPLPENCARTTTLPTLVEFGYSNFNSRFPFKGGESSGLAHLHEYIWNKNLVKSYKDSRNQMMGTDNSTKFSPWLCNGSLSPRKIYFELKNYESQQNKRDAAYWIIFELIWRDFFKFIAMKFGSHLFHANGLKSGPYVWKHDLQQFEAWRTGNTGVPFVDANMREIMSTGWMSNRGRQNVASYLTKDLGIDWRYGAVWFESVLIDHDVCSNYGNWIYVAGIGNDPREHRHFNMIKQAFDYDPNGDYVRMWCPELARLPNEYIHTPWLTPLHMLKNAGVELGVNYPRPLIIIPQWNQQVSFRRTSLQRQPPTQQRGIDFYFKTNDKRQ